MAALFPFGELLLYSCDLCLAVLSGFVFALFNLFIGNYLTVSVSNNGHPDQFALLQCIIHFVSAGIAAFFISILHHISINTTNQSVEVRLSTVYRRQLAIFVRDLTFLLASISIGCFTSLSLTIPVLVIPFIVTAWTTLFEKQNPPIVRGLFLAGPLCLFFINFSLGGFYGTFLVDAKQINEPGIIFTIVAGIGSSAIQFAKARAQFKPLSGNHHAPQLYVHDENLDKLEYEKNPVEQYNEQKSMEQQYNTTTTKAKEDAAERGEHGNCWTNDSSKNNGANSDSNQPPQRQNGSNDGKSATLTQIIGRWLRIQCSLLQKWPCQCVAGFVACLIHSFAYPVFTRLTGLFFSVFEHKLGKEGDSVLKDVRLICSAYALMGLIVFGAVTFWNTIFGQIGRRLLDQLKNGPKFHEKFYSKRIACGQIEIVPLLPVEFVYGLASILISIASSLQNNRPMGFLAAGIFCFQVILQHLACNFLNQSKNGRAIGFATTNGLQQFSQAMAYAGGFVLVQYKLITPLNVFKIIQTMHLGSMGMTSAVLLANDFEKGSKEMALLIADLKQVAKISPERNEKIKY